MTEPSTEPAVDEAAEPAPETTVTEFTPAEVPEAEDNPVIEHAPSFLAATPHLGAPHVTIQWGEPNEGRADSYTVEVTGQPPAEGLGGHVLGVTYENLTPGDVLTVNVTSITGDNQGTLTVSNVVVGGPAEEPADETPQEG